jgi:long-chain acyl-CoA synthetase
MLSTVAGRNSARIALVEPHGRVSYGELEKAVAAFAESLWQAGVRPGSRAAVFLPNGLEFVRSFFAIARVGAVVVPLNDQYRETELSRLLEDGAFSFAITSKPSAGLWERVAAAAAKPCKVVHVEDHPWKPGGRVEGELPEISPDAPVLQQFSSGSTGRPKRICKTHRNLLFELDSLKQTLALGAEDRFLGVTPFSHVNGLMRSMMASIRAGATLYPLPRFAREKVVETIETNRISVFIGVPFMFGVLAKSRFDRPPDFSSLRLCVSGSAPMSLNLNRRFHEKFGLHVRQLYGSTETGTISVDLSADTGKALESVGKPIAGVEVRVFDERGEPAQAGETGEIAVRSPAAIRSYEAGGELDDEVFRGGFFFTGDLGCMDEEGRIYLIGRKKLFINKGGYKINPREVEEVLESHPKVEEAVVIGVRTPFEDEKVQAVVVANAPCTAQELLEHCRGMIADFKIPSVVEFRDTLPKSATGKVQRALLIESPAQER